MQLQPVTGAHTCRFISVFAGSPTERDKTRPIVTRVETARASFTGRPLLCRAVISATLNVVPSEINHCPEKCLHNPVA